MSEKLYCTIDRSFAKYNCGPSLDPHDPVGSDNNWVNSNEGTSSHPNLGIYAGYASWNDNDDNPKGSFNWRSVIRFTVSTKLPSTATIDELVVKMPLRGESSTSYPYHSYVILSKQPPYNPSTETGIKPNQLCKPAKITVNNSGSLRQLDCSVNRNIAIGVPTDSRAYAYIIKDGKYERPKDIITENTHLYYRLLPSSLTPGGTYYLYFVRQGDCKTTDGCVRHRGSGHGVSGYVHLRISESDTPFVLIKYTNAVNFSIKATLDGGSAVSDFSSYGTVDFKLAGVSYTGKTSYSEDVTPGTTFELIKVSPKSGYSYVGGTPSFEINSGKTHILNFKTCHTLTFVGDGGTRKTVTKNKGDSYPIPTYKNMFGTVPSGKTFNGWKVGSTTYIGGNSITVSSDITFTAILTSNSYKLNYNVDGVVVHTQDVTYGESFTIATISDSYLKPAERTLTGWKYGNNNFSAGTWSYTSDVTIVAQFSAKIYTLKFKHGSTDVSTVNVKYNEDVTNKFPTSIPNNLSSTSSYFNNSYQKLEAWKLNDNSSPSSWSNLLKSGNRSGDVITLNSVIGPRFKVVVYKNKKWRIHTPVVSRETNKWHVLYPRISK